MKNFTFDRLIQFNIEYCRSNVEVILFLFTKILMNQLLLDVKQVLVPTFMYGKNFLSHPNDFLKTFANQVL